MRQRCPSSDNVQSAHVTLTDALLCALRPLARLAIARRVTFPAFAEIAKGAFMAAAERDFPLEGARVTDSRLSLLTGLQRRDVKRLRGGEAPDPGMGPVPRLLAAWAAEGGAPKDAEAFAALAASISRDLHPRTLRDELIRDGAAEADGDVLRLRSAAWVPEDEGARLAYLGANLGDHGAAAAANLLAGAGHLERAVHYNRLSAESATALAREAHERLEPVLAEINALARERQAADAALPAAARTHRFRAGAYAWREAEE